MELTKETLSYMKVLVTQIRQAMSRRNTVEARRRLLDLENELINITLENDKGAVQEGRDAAEAAFEDGERII